MKSLELWTLDYLLNSIWQVPLVFAAAWVAARLARCAGPAVEHRLWVSALLLEALLPACSIQPAQLFGAWLGGVWRLASRFWTASAAGGGARVTVIYGPGFARGLLHLPSVLLTAVACAYGFSVIYFAMRVLWRLQRTDALRRRAQRMPLNATAQRIWSHSRRFFAVHDAEVAFSGQLSGPVTLGIRRRLVLMPVGWASGLPDADLTAAIAHEFAHMRRRDFAKNLLYEVISLSVAYHPLLWLTRVRLAESREMVCDAMASEAVAGREQYAHSLLRLASTVLQSAPSKTVHGIGIFDTHNLERRVMNLTQEHVQVRGARRLAMACACVAIGVATCASAMTLRMVVSAPAAQSGPAPSRVMRVPGRIMAGNLLTKAVPVYPPDAKKAGITGSVMLHAVIDKDGSIHSLTVISGPDELRQSALDAIRQWTYKPYLLNGNPMQVETTITVNYSLQH